MTLIAVPASAVRAAIQAQALYEASLAAAALFAGDATRHAVVAIVGAGFHVIDRTGHVSHEIWSLAVARGVRADIEAVLA